MSTSSLWIRFCALAKGLDCIWRLSQRLSSQICSWGHFMTSNLWHVLLKVFAKYNIYLMFSFVGLFQMVNPLNYQTIWRVCQEPTVSHHNVIAGIPMRYLNLFTDFYFIRFFYPILNCSLFMYRRYFSGTHHSFVCTSFIKQDYHQISGVCATKYVAIGHILLLWFI